MKFDFVIGNPPYQDETIGENEGYTPPVYHNFLDESYKIADSVIMIHPARFLFNAGSTPKQWNYKMLNDNHFKVLTYEPISSKIFINTDIKGGVVITYRDKNKIFEKIEEFIIYDELKNIVKKVKSRLNKKMSSIIYASEAYHFTEKMHEDFPEIESKLSKGHKYDLKSNVFEKLKNIVFFENEEKEDYIKILGVIKNKRCELSIDKKYINPTENFYYYKVFLSRANGSGKYGEILTSPFVMAPKIGHTQTFMSIGKFETSKEAERCKKYICTKFVRALLGVKKVTQSIPIAAWELVPLEDFTDNSDIDWKESISNIDKQLYKKYSLSETEINFIENNVKEMV